MRIKYVEGRRRDLRQGDDADYTAGIGENRGRTRTRCATTTSLITPNTVYDLDMKAETRTEEARSGARRRPANYVAERIWAKRATARIPVSLAYRKDFKRDGTAPLYQYGYGSYGASTDAVFLARFSLIDRGFVYAIARAWRPEMGRSWYETASC